MHYREHLILKGWDNLVVILKEPCGIDISLWEYPIYWNIVSPKPTCVIAKASEDYFPDPTVVEHCENMKGLGYLRGLYHFLREDDIARQIRVYLDVCREVGALVDNVWKFEFPPVLDVEVVAENKGSRFAGQVKAWLDGVELATKRRPMIYTSQYYWNDYVCSKFLWTTIAPSWTNDYPLWCAQYFDDPNLHKEPHPLPKGWTNWVGWQYYTAARFEGIPHNGVDVNLFKQEYLDTLTNNNYPLENFTTSIIIGNNKYKETI